MAAAFGIIGQHGPGDLLKPTIRSSSKLNYIHDYYDRWRTASKSVINVAMATFKESAWLAIGILA